MRAVIYEGFGGVEVLKIVSLPDPEPGPEQLLVRVRAAALNRADTLQRKGEYSPPPGESTVLGIEIAGEVVAAGSGVRGIVPGERVFGLIGSGGYAELCLLDQGMAIPVPEGWSWAEAAAVPEGFFVADTTLIQLGKLKKENTVLVHAAGSGMGSACVQLAHHVGAEVLCTAGSAEKIERAKLLGAVAGVNHKTHDFAEEVLRLTGGEGVDLVVDFVGATYLSRNLAVLKPGGRLVQAGLLTGWEATLNLMTLVLRRLQILGTAMRPLPIAEKRLIAARFREQWLPELVAGRLVPIVDSVFPFTEVARAHETMEENRNFGKIVLTFD
ncbi:MAG: NAD(P)H-quinone oxidoreductase [Acidobacteriota bacterium]|nr:NAD(P)H-quinone oxidoreductase [Acidobacteriota bacterium]